ncbi:MAG: hypothetical protein AVDCRST_MAG27-2820, partial [uncultured Craurococcus sp.]
AARGRGRSRRPDDGRPRARGFRQRRSGAGRRPGARGGGARRRRRRPPRRRHGDARR